MYNLDSKTKLDALHGLAMKCHRIERYIGIIEFGEDARISFEQGWVIRDKNGVSRTGNIQQEIPPMDVINDLVGQKIERALAHRNNSVEIFFSNGVSLALTENPDAESYEIVGPGIYLLV